MLVERYQEGWTYEWKKSKARLDEVEAVQSFKNLGDPSWFKNGHYTYVIDEKQLYRAKHTKKLRYVGTEIHPDVEGV